MSNVAEVRHFALDEFDQRYATLRLQATAEARQAMIQSMVRYGQVSPLVVWRADDAWVLIDGFKRVEAAKLRRAEQEHISHLELAERLLAVPAQRRRERSAELRIKKAKFREAATLEAFDWKFNGQFIDRVQMEELATGEFIRRRDNLVFVGQSGLGKSHLIEAIGRRCCVAGYRVRYITSGELLHKLGTSLADGTMPKQLRYYAGFELLIIDELGFDKLEREQHPQAPSLLYKVIDSRTRKRSTALVTNIDFGGWGKYLGDPPIAMALLDRVVDGAIIHKFQGKSYRAHRASPARQSGNASTT